MSTFNKNKNGVNVENMTSKGYFRRNRFYHPVVAGNTNILAAVTLSDGATQDKTTFVAQPDFARTIRIKGNASECGGLKVTVTGTDIRNAVITEEITNNADGTTATDGVKAFKTVTKIVMPARGAAGNTISVGYGAKLGLDRKCAGNEVLMGTTDGVLESTAPVITADATDICKNVVLFSTALANTKIFVVNYVATEVTSDRHIL